MARLINRSIHHAIEHPRSVVVAGLLFAAACGFLIPKVDINQYFNEELPAAHPVSAAQKMFEQDFGGFLGPEISVRRHDGGTVIDVLVAYTPGVQSRYGSSGADALIIQAVVSGMMDVPEMRRLYRVARVDFWIAMAAILGVLSGGVLAGVMIGIALSVVWLVYVSAAPYMPELGRKPGTQVFRSVDEYPDSETYPGLLVLGFDAGLFFASADSLQDRLRELALDADPAFDTASAVAADGSYEIIASPEPQPRNWLQLKPDAGSITTRHYWEWERNVAADPTFHVPLWIEPIEDPGPAPPMDDAAIAAGMAFEALNHAGELQRLTIRIDHVQVDFEFRQHALRRDRPHRFDGDRRGLVAGPHARTARQQNHHRDACKG